jgi:NitT/TauT family transport system substrate-binding protein
MAPMIRLLRGAAVLLLASGLAGTAAQAQSPATITIGVVPSLPSAPTYLAIERGYFRDMGVDAKLEIIDSAAKAIPLLASNRMQIVEGGLAVGFFNALAQGLPISLALERGSSPVYQRILVRPDLKDEIKTIRDLKGRSVSLVAPGSIVVYQLGKVLESAGLTLNDVDVKYMPFPSMGAALANKAIDTALIVSPFSDLVIEKGLGLPWIDADEIIRPTPFALLGYMINTDWAEKNRDTAGRIMIALARGARDYCQAYHHGPQRAEVVDVLLKYDHSIDRALLERIPWQARDPNGGFNMASVLDIQNWFFTHGMIEKVAPADRIVDTSYAAEVAKALGPFELINKASPIPGCR